ncbi:MAG: cell division topological specificity factor MinE [Clostridia bacterium]|nr:cell division topological specificity factor MinE [Clostridia bacterium]
METRGIAKLKQVLINDKHFNPIRLNEIVKSEIFKVMQNYMEIDSDDIITKIDIDVNGSYVLKCKVRSNRLKVLGIIPN